MVNSYNIFNYNKMAYQCLFGFLISIFISDVHAGQWCYSTGDKWDIDADRNYCDKGCCIKSGTTKGEECCGLNTSTILGIVFGCVVGTVALISIICACRQYAQRGQSCVTVTRTIVTAGGTTTTNQHVRAPPQQFGQNGPYGQPQPSAQTQPYGQPQSQQNVQPQPYSQPSAPSIEPQAPPLDQQPPSYDSVIRKY